MRYVSTRGQSPSVGFVDAVLAGLAPDGGLYIPEAWPAFTADEIAGFAGRPYHEVAAAVIGAFAGDEIPRADLLEMCREAYATFKHAAVVPLVQLGPDTFMAELFHGPSLAFKDVAMQILARLYDHVLGQQNRVQTILCATSGDTGGAAVEAFRGRKNVRVVALFPEGRISAVQRRFMTTAPDANVACVAVAGTFDDCQAIVKQAFQDQALRQAVDLSGVNSINFARIAAQAVYYFTSAAALGAPGRPVSFCVPSGNFGDAFAGYVASRMGLPVARIVVATNSNDILARTLESGAYETGGVVPTISPSMDIQVSSNFERLLFESLGRDADGLKRLMNGLTQSGHFTIPPKAIATIRESFAAGRASEAETSATIAQTWKACGYLLDPHTAVGVAVASRLELGDAPVVLLATAHPAKFPAAVKAATGIEPPLPAWLSDLYDRPERYDILANDQGAVESYIRARSRAGRN